MNNVLHLGNLIGAPLSADVFARYCRSQEYDTLFIYGTDEHGTATEIQALTEGVTPQQLCDKYYVLHQQVNEWIGISSDTFGRTSTPEHHKTTQEVFLLLQKNGYITQGVVDQLYSPSLNRFLADRFVFGVCPHCTFNDARGDQCDKCGKLLDAIELINPVSKLDNKPLEIKKSTHLFLDLPKLEPQLRSWFEKRSKEGFWTKNAISTTQAWLDKGLEPRCITRDLSWGVRVPKEGFENKVFYVWFDAVLGYLSMTRALRDDWKEWWQSGHSHLYQFMGKDNIPFHSIILPGIFLGTQDNYSLVYHLQATEYLNYEDGKFSKSRGVGVFGTDAISTGIAPDVWRYYLLSHRPEGADATFSWKEFQESNNSELLANLGNFVNRTLTFVKNNFEGRLPSVDYRRQTTDDSTYLDTFKKEKEKCIAHYEAVQLRDALKTTMQISRRANAYFQEQAPWKLIKEDKERCAQVITICTQTILELATLLEPSLPFTAKVIAQQLNTTLPTLNDNTRLKAGHTVGSVQPVFRKLEDKEIEALREKFSGKQKTDARLKTDDGQRVTTDMGRTTNDVLLDLRVGVITDVKNHPSADKLYIVSVDLGTEKRTLVAGLKALYTPEELKEKHAIILCNLKPATIRGVQSNGMILTAEESDKKFVVLEAPHSPAGAIINTGSQTTDTRGQTADGGRQTVKSSTVDRLPTTRPITYDDFLKLPLRTKNKRVLLDKTVLATSIEPLVVDVADESRIR